MSQITIQCRLIARVSTRKELWKLMAELNTPLINELLISVCQHPDFETWRHKGKVPTGTIKELCEPLKTDLRFAGQSVRFYTSAINTVSYTYKSWLKIQKRLQLQLEGKTHWLEMLKSDAELIEESKETLDSIRNKASEILAQLTPESTNIKKQKKGKKNKNPKKSKDDKSLSNALFDAYKNTEDILTRCAIGYLLKNGCKLTQTEEDAEKFIKRRRKLEIQIQRLTEQIESRIPKGRDLTDTEWQRNLILATNQVPKNEAEAKSWQNALLRKSNSVPFPVTYETSEDMIWSKNEKGRICVRFSSIREHTFEIYCDNRQLHWFKRFLLDQEVKKNSKNQHSSSLFTLRSGRISWQEGQGKGEPWNIHHLTLYCTVDTRLWTAEGTKLVAQEKAEEIAKIITRTKEKGQLNDNQLINIKRKNTTLARINNPYPRPSKPLYKGQSHILLGVSLGLEKPATVAVVDMISGKVFTYRSIKQLLGNNYRLLNRQRQQKKALSHKRKVAQSQAAPNQYGDSELGEYIDRLLAKEIIAIAQKYSAGSIVLPKLEGMREQINSEIQAKAEEKCPESIEAQKKYAKQYRRSVNQWSYGRLIENINSQAAQAGIVIEETKQCVKGSPQDKAKEIASAAYKSRNKS
ncbi:MAG: type V CRISPR-associated protein Cas12k [Cyanobacteria bacterium J06632_19]